MNPSLHFLRAPRPLAAQVAAWLLREVAPSRDLTGMLVLVPTAGAARRIRAELAAQGGALAPRFCEPMEALLAFAGVEYAKPYERMAAWAAALEKAQAGKLFADTEFLKSPMARLRMAATMVGLVDELAEGGWKPENFAQWPDFPEPERWKEIEQLHRFATQTLEENGLADPATLQVQKATEVSTFEGHVVIACVPDLPRVVQKWLENSQGCVSVLVWAPEDLQANWDAWGRPVEVQGPWPPLETISPQPSPGAEAQAALKFLARAADGSGACVLADPELVPAFWLEARERGCGIYEPGGKPLSQTPAGRAVLLWNEFRNTKKLSTLRLLAEDPAFAKNLNLDVSSPQLLAALDALAVGCLAQTLEQTKETECGKESQWKALVERLEELLSEPLPPHISESPNADAQAVADLWHGLKSSSVVPAELRPSVFAAALTEARLFEPREDDKALELNGWLEAPWLQASSLAVCGCTTGVLPAKLDHGPFLPDGLRQELGLSCAHTRRLRDAYMIASLVASRSAGALLFTFSQTAADGSPQMPSELLLCGPTDGLALRVLRLFQPAKSQPRSQPSREGLWRWRLPDALRKPPPETLRVTDFGQYLKCPWRFYFLRVLGVEAFDPRARELDAVGFGGLLHAVLEAFGQQYKNLVEEAEIEKAVIALIEGEAIRRFGKKPPPALRIQIENAKARLRAFARCQAEQRQKGWEIIHVEHPLHNGGGKPFCIKGLKLSGRVDRIEHHPKEGFRILDYKTGSRAMKPQDAHLGSASRGWLAESLVKIGQRFKAWTDLQLPLYCLFARKMLGKNQKVQAGYFVLPADTASTAIHTFEMDKALLKSAITCAQAVARHIRAGIFWPPQPWRYDSEDPLEPVLAGRSPEEAIEEETREFFEGRRR